MSLDREYMSRTEAALLALAATGMLVWYGYPQVLFSLYPVYEVLRLLLPGRFPPLAGN